jgi:hypothetical protein
MKTPSLSSRVQRRRAAGGVLQIDLVVGMAILTLAIVPLGFSFEHERQVLKAEYFRSAALEIVDGEMEILAAGDWRHFPDGTQNYPVHSPTLANLPPGTFQLTKTGNHLRLIWASDQHKGIGEIVREITVP